MTTLNQMIAIIEAENPVLKTGNEEQGYEEIKGALYDQIIAQWAQWRLNKEAKQAEAEIKAEKKAAAEAKLAALGLDADDLEALGLG